MPLLTLSRSSPLAPFDQGFSSERRPQLDRRIVIVRPSHPLRPEAEACIGDVYERAFGARGLAFPRRLIALLNDSGHPVCAAGLRTPAEGFFSEVYLDLPIERVLAAESGGPVERSRIFEVTTLASRTSDISPLFIRQLALLGKIAGFDWSFFTATARLRKLLCQLGIPIIEIEVANPARMPAVGCWGSYYTHAPIVCAVNKRWLDDRVIVPQPVSGNA